VNTKYDARQHAITEIMRLANQIDEFGLGVVVSEMRKIHAECPRKVCRDGKVYAFPVKAKS